LDTNVLVYAALGSGKDERKRKRALELIESEDLGAELALEWIEQPLKRSEPTRSTPKT